MTIQRPMTPDTEWTCPSSVPLQAYPSHPMFPRRSQRRLPCALPEALLLLLPSRGLCRMPCLAEGFRSVNVQGHNFFARQGRGGGGTTAAAAIMQMAPQARAHGDVRATPLCLSFPPLAFDRSEALCAGPTRILSPTPSASSHASPLPDRYFFDNALCTDLFSPPNPPPVRLSFFVCLPG